MKVSSNWLTKLINIFSKPEFGSFLIVGSSENFPLFMSQYGQKTDSIMDIFSSNDLEFEPLAEF